LARFYWGKPVVTRVKYGSNWRNCVMDGTNNNTLRQVDLDVHAPAFDAYNSLKSQFDQLQQCPQQARSEGQGGSGLPDSQLDKLAVVWLAQKSSALGRDITRADLEAPQATNFDSAMAARASQQYETIRSAHFDPEGGFLLVGSHDKDAITSKDIDASLKKIEKQRQSMDYADPLMANNGALFYELSKVHDGVRSINYWDLKEARSVDDYQRARGTHLFTDEQRSLIDRMYHRWSKDDMRGIEVRPQDSNMGCDGEITADTLAKGTGFNSAKELSNTFNRPVQLVTPAEYCADTQASARQAEAEAQRAEAARQHQIIQIARTALQAEKDAIQEQSYYSVTRGQGFDQIARRVMSTENGQVPSERNVVGYSRSIAQMNGYDRDHYDPKKRSLQPGQSLQVHDSDWQLQQWTDAVGEVNDYVRRNIDNQH
jgi:hypothetical protein